MYLCVRNPINLKSRILVYPSQTCGPDSWLEGLLKPCKEYPVTCNSSVLPASAFRTQTPNRLPVGLSNYVERGGGYNSTYPKGPRTQIIRF